MLDYSSISTKSSIISRNDNELKKYDYFASLDNIKRINIYTSDNNTLEHSCYEINCDSLSPLSARRIIQQSQSIEVLYLNANKHLHERLSVTQNKNIEIQVGITPSYWDLKCPPEKIIGIMHLTYSIPFVYCKYIAF